MLLFEDSLTKRYGRMHTEARATVKVETINALLC